MLRTRPAHWFELVTSRDHFARAMQVLAATGAAQLEAKPLDASEPVLPHLEDFFQRFNTLAKQHGPYWPADRNDAGVFLENPIRALDQTLETLTLWADRADPLITRLQTLDAATTELGLIATLVDSVGADYPLERLTEAQSRFLDHAIFFVPGADFAALDADGLLLERFAAPEGTFVIVIGDQPDMQRFAPDMAALKARPVALPDFLTADGAPRADQVQARLRDVAAQRAETRATLDQLSDEFDLARVLSQVAVLDWLYHNSADIQATKYTIRITGWTSSADGTALRDALDAAGADYVLNVSPQAPDSAPMVFTNPRWLRVFEFFPRMLGVPALGEVDPSPLTAVIAPILFGFMFGDVGQGAVLVVLGLLLSHRMPFLMMLVPGGLAAMVFGVLFGSVFSLETVIPALWLHPLHHPLPVLAAALGLGVVLLLLGIGLDLLQAVWHRATLRWLRMNGGLTLAFICLLASYWWPLLLWGAPLGVALTAAGARDEHGLWTPGAMAKALAEFLEGIMRLLVSTVSFSRVGAFALAHAGLSAAVVGVADAAGSVGFWVILLLGNVLIIALEGLVTGIQTTRLILFEFFIRFFRAEGREFHPLTAPPHHLNTTEGTQT